MEFLNKKILSNLLPPSSKSIIVFGRNKLNGTDGIMPLLQELTQKNNSKLIFCVANYKSAYKAILTNQIFKDIILNNGSLNLLGGNSNIRAIRYFFWFIQLSLISLHGIFKAKFIHYGELNSFPFKVIRIFFRNRIYLIENNTNETYYGKALDQITEICLGKIRKSKPNYLFDLSCQDKRIIFRESTLKKIQKYKSISYFYYGRSRSRSSWLNYLMDNKEKYLANNHPGFIKNKFIVVIGTWYGGCFYNEIQDAFQAMLDVFQENFSDEFFLYKPHPLTDLNYVNNEFKKRFLNYEITSLHPNLLSTEAKLFIGNTFSNVMTDAYLLGIPTIEFSKYIKQLYEITNGHSYSTKFVTEYINFDKKKLSLVLMNYSKKNIQSLDITKYSYDNPEANLLIEDLRVTK